MHEQAEREAVLRDHRGDMFDAIDRLIADARAAGRADLETSVAMLQISKRRAESRVDEALERIDKLGRALGAAAEALHDGGDSYYHGGGPIRSCEDPICKTACALFSEGAEDAGCPQCGNALDYPVWYAFGDVDHSDLIDHECDFDE